MKHNKSVESRRTVMQNSTAGFPLFSFVAGSSHLLGTLNLSDFSFMFKSTTRARGEGGRGGGVLVSDSFVRLSPLGASVNPFPSHRENASAGIYYLCKRPDALRRSCMGVKNEGRRSPSRRPSSRTIQKSL